jgi:hypothetical protein
MKKSKEKKKPKEIRLLKTITGKRSRAQNVAGRKISYFVENYIRIVEKVEFCSLHTIF